MPQALQLPIQETSWRFQKILESKGITRRYYVYIGACQFCPPIILEVPRWLSPQSLLAFDSGSPYRMLPYLHTAAAQSMSVDLQTVFFDT